MPVKGSKQHIDKAFVNSSWKAMSRLLDEDLPTPKNYDKTIITVLILALLLAVSSAIYLGIKLHNQTPVAGIQNERVVTKTVFKDRFILADNALLPNSNSYSIPVSQYPIESNYPNRVNASELSSEMTQDYANQADTNRDIIPNSPFELEQIESINPELISSYQLPNAAVFQDNKRIKKLKKPNAPKYHFGLLAFTANNTDYTGHGVTTGVEIPISKKWGINTGVAFNFVSRDHHFFPFFEKDVRDELYKSSQDLNLEDQSTYYSGLRSFKQVYIPVGLNYNLNEAFGFNTGMKFRYTYSEKVDKVLLNSASKKIPVNEEAENVFFNRTNIGLYAGVKYSVSRNVSFALDSEWGLSSIINRNNFDFPSNRTKYDLNLINLSTNISF